MVAKDAGKPQMVSDQSAVNIEVVRNQNAPEFERQEYAVAIPQNVGQGAAITQLRANDNDPQVNYMLFLYVFL